MRKRARRLGLIVSNPVTGIPKLKQTGTRIAYLSLAGEMAVLAALPTEYRPLVVFAAKTGLPWSEQARLRWLDVDLFSGFLTVRLVKNGQAARGALAELSAQRMRPRDHNEQLSRAAYRTVSHAFVRAVKAAQASLRAATKARRPSASTG
jgi:integrase